MRSRKWMEVVRSTLSTMNQEMSKRGRQKHAHNREHDDADSARLESDTEKRLQTRRASAVESLVDNQNFSKPTHSAASAPHQFFPRVTAVFNYTIAEHFFRTGQHPLLSPKNISNLRLAVSWPVIVRCCCPHLSHGGTTMAVRSLHVVPEVPAENTAKQNPSRTVRFMMVNEI